MLKNFISNYLKDLKIFKKNYFNSNYSIPKINKAYSKIDKSHYITHKNKEKFNKLMVFKSLTNSPTTSPRTKRATTSSSDVPTPNSSDLNNPVIGDVGSIQNNNSNSTDSEINNTGRTFVGRWRGLKHVKSQVFQEEEEGGGGGGGAEDQNDPQSTKSNGSDTTATVTQNQEMSNSNNNSNNLTANKTRSSSWAFWQSSSPQPFATKETAATSTSEEQRQPDTVTNDLNNSPVNSTGIKKVIVNGTETSIDPASSTTTTATTDSTNPNNIDKTQRSQSWSIWNLSRLSFSEDPNSPSITAAAQSSNPNSRLSSPNVILTSTFENLSNLGNNNNKTKTNSKDNTSSKNFPQKEDAILSETSYVKTNEDQIENNEPDKKRPKKTKHPNKIVPSLEECLPLETTTSSIYRKVKKLSTYLGYNKSNYINHLNRCEAKVFKRVLIIGVHGFFPTRMIRPLIGAPTGTSMKFTNEAEKAIISWAKDNQMDVAIQKIALEKDGKIFDRVEFFFEIMSKWKSEIEKADFIFIAAHSQGTPVSILLLSKLIEYGIINPNKKIGILAMAGINNGPYLGVDQTFLVRAYSAIENESMLELFQFQNFESSQSKKYLEAIRIIISYGVKICYIGSINDQMVPLYSSIASHVFHPNIYRAVYIDGGSNTPDFVSRVVSLSTWLLNIGYSDHDVIKEISHALAGPLTGGGHSKIYNDINVYKTALDFILKTTDFNGWSYSDPSGSTAKYQLSPSSAATASDSSTKAERIPEMCQQPVRFEEFDIKRIGSNPYNLPWCTRGLFHEVLKRIPEGDKQIEMVFKEFGEWNPESKALKDIKYRLNGIRAKL